MSSFQRAQLGIGYVPEGRRVFGRLSVEDNLKMGAYAVKDKERLKKNISRVYEIFPRLGERSRQLAGTMSGGEQQMLAIGRALMSSPRMLLLDEPSMGLSPIMTDEVFDVLKELKRQKTTIFLIEQNAYDALAISDRAYIMETGRITLEGKSADLMQDSRVRDAYLGGSL